MPLYLSVQDNFKRLLSNHFDKKIEINKRVKIISDLQMFRPKEDKSVWGEKKGKIPEHFMVSMDGEHICTFNETDDPKKALLMFWKGLLEAYKTGRVKLTPPWMTELKPEVSPNKVVEDEIKKIKPTTKAEKMAKEVIKRIANAK